MVLTAAILLSALYWLISAAMVVRVLRAIPVLNRLRPPDPPHWPKLCIVIPACNEADAIEAALTERLRDDYPDLQIVLVEDRSTDATPAIADKLATSDARLHVVHITDLPDGWLGKVHAMHVGATFASGHAENGGTASNESSHAPRSATQPREARELEGTQVPSLHRGQAAATGEWLLFSDADVHVAPGTMRRAVAYCEQRGLDHLALLPELWPSTFLLDTMLATFIRVLCLSSRIWGVENPKSRASGGVGAFNLVRRTALDRIGGFERLRLTVVDDMGLGQLLKRSGARSSAVNGRELVGLHFYRSVVEMARGAEKSIFVVFNFNLVRLIGMTTLFAALELAPFAGIVLASQSWLRVVAAIASAVAVGQSLLINRWVHRPLLASALFPIGVILNAIITIRAGVLAAIRGGIMWRGTLYSNELLRGAEQLEFP